MTKPLQHIQNAAAHLIYNLPKFSHVTPSSVIPTGFLFQDDGAGLQGLQRNCPCLPLNTCQTTLNYICWLAGTTIAESKQWLLSEVVTLLCSVASVIERTPHQCHPPFFSFISINVDILWFLSCDKCTNCQFLWTKVSAKSKFICILITSTCRSSSRSTVTWVTCAAYPVSSVDFYHHYGLLISLMRI